MCNVHNLCGIFIDKGIFRDFQTNQPPEVQHNHPPPQPLPPTHQPGASFQYNQQTPQSPQTYTPRSCATLRCDYQVEDNVER